MAGDFSVPFTLENMAEGKLKEDFEKHYTDVLNSLKKGDKGSVTIKVELNRPKDMDTLINTIYEISSKKPKLKVGAVAAITENQETLKLMTDEPQKPQGQQLNVVDIKTKEAN